MTAPTPPPRMTVEQRAAVCAQTIATRIFTGGTEADIRGFLMGHITAAQEEAREEEKRQCTLSHKETDLLKRDGYAKGFKEGQERMRERCAEVSEKNEWKEHGNDNCINIAPEIRAFPLEEASA